ncbi:uncharacterized protein [Paramormyrops kingsleyae]|uniref:uncharacterized protein isoform X1 n=2 Tax=Paramormyrops kingsleyae TaxID=1676925 RepID=UPI003B973A81
MSVSRLTGLSMSQVQTVYREIPPITLQLPEESTTARLYCSAADGMEARISALVEVFLVKVYRCRACQFTSSLKGRITTHVTERHDRGHPCPPLTCLDRDEGDSLDVKVGVAEDDLDSCTSAYDLEDELHSAAKERDEHMALDRLPFLMPVYSMLQNISPRSCDVSLGPGAEVAHTCEVSTLFEEDEEESSGEEAARFHLEDSSAVELPEPLSCSMGSVSPEAQDQEAQSAHLMSLGLYRISSIKCHPPAGAPESRATSVQLGQDGSESAPDEKVSVPGKAAEDPVLSCIPTQNLKGRRGEQGLAPSLSGRAAEQYSETECHWRGHSKPGRVRAGIPQDFQQRRRRGSGPALAQCARCLAWCRSEREFEQHDRCHVQGGFRCLHCSFTDEAWDEVHKHIVSQHEGPEAAQQDGVGSQSPPPHDPSEREQERGRKRVKRRRRRQREGRKVRGVRDFYCPLCDRKFSTKLTLHRHMGIHQGAKPFGCPHCPYSSRLKASLVQHLRVHTGEKPFQCSRCSYASIDRSSLLRHSRRHTQERPHRCQHCPYSSIQKKSLDLHVRRYHTRESFPCPQCCYSTPDRQLLLRHVRKQHASKSPPPPARPRRPRIAAGGLPPA